MSKQKKFDTSIIKGWDKEWHLRGYNFNGPYTQNMERMSLNYKGYIGTKSYYLPANKIDLSAFKHDLQYFSPSPIARMLADKEYWNNLPEGEKKAKFLSGSFIYGAWAGRMIKELAKLGITGFRVKKAMPELFKIYKSLWIPTGKETGFYLPTKLFGKEGVIPKKLREELNEFFFNTFGVKLTTARGGAFKKRFKAPIINLLFNSLFLGSSLVPEPIKKFRNFYNTVLDDYKESEEFKDLKRETEKVEDSYKKYLDTVGSFNKDGDFIIKDDINENEAKRSYIDYYKQSKKYFEWLNDYYESYPNFKEYVKATYPKDNEWKFPKLNVKELDKVANPVMKKPEPLIIPPDFKVLDPFPVDVEGIRMPDLDKEPEEEPEPEWDIEFGEPEEPEEPEEEPEPEWDIEFSK